MKRVLTILAVVIVVAVLAVWAAAAFLVKPEALRGIVVEQAKSALGRDVELGQLDLDLFPAPAIRAAGLSVGGAPDEPAPLLQAKELRLRLALLPLLGGKIVLSTVELREPAIQLPVDADGFPRAPVLGPPSGAEKRGEPAPGGEARPEGGEPSSPPALAIQSVVVSGASLRAGEWQISDLDVEGELEPDGRAQLALGAKLPGLGEIRDGKVDLAGLLGGGELSVNAAASLQDIDLAALAQRLKLVPAPLAKLAGRLSGPVRASLVGSEVKEAGAELQAKGLSVRMDSIELDGDVPIQAALGGDLTLDLTQAALRVPPSVNKPVGDTLRIDGKLGRELSAAALKSLVLMLGPNQIPVTPQLAKNTVDIGACSIDLAPLARWVDTQGRTLAGTVRVEPLQLKLEPLEVRGDLALQDVVIGMEHGPIQVSGQVAARGKQVRSEGLQAVVGGQTIAVEGGYDLERGTVQLDVGADKAKLDAMLAALTGDAKVAGILGTKVSLSGEPSLEKLQGSGTLSIEPGKVQGFSLINAVLGKLGPIVEQIAQSRGKDLSRYQQEDFKELQAQFQLANGRMQLSPVALDYRYARAELRGSVNLLDETVDLKGQIELAPEVTSDLINAQTDRTLVVPIEGITGPMTSPRVEISASVVARTLVQLAGQVGVAKKFDDKLGKRIEEKYGKEGREAVEGLIDGIFGGGRRRQPAREVEPERDPDARPGSRDDREPPPDDLPPDSEPPPSERDPFPEPR